MYKDAEKRREYARRYYHANRERLLARERELRIARLVGPKGDKMKMTRAAIWKRYYVKHSKELAARGDTRRTRLRRKVFAAYGDRCACCGETIPTFLTLDHVNRDGKAHRAKFGGRGSSLSVYYDLQRQGWPKDGYRILCMNCNFATRFGGLCPHQTTEGMFAI